jgi:hypothetical protein
MGSNKGRGLLLGWHRPPLRRGSRISRAASRGDLCFRHSLTRRASTGGRSWISGRRRRTASLPASRQRDRGLIGPDLRIACAPHSDSWTRPDLFCCLPWVDTKGTRREAQSDQRFAKRLHGSVRMSSRPADQQTKPQVDEVDARRGASEPAGFETGAVSTAPAESETAKPQVKPSGGGRESNPPASFRRHTGFEDRGSLVRGRAVLQVSGSSIPANTVLTHVGPQAATR